MSRLSKREKLRYCEGCHDGIYNLSECNSLSTAKLVWRLKVRNDQRPPFADEPIQVLHCRHGSPWCYLAAVAPRRGKAKGARP